MFPDDAATIVDVLARRARAHPDRPAYIFLADGESESGRLTYAETDRRARAVGARLGEVGSVGDRVLITYPAAAGLEYVVSFLGCLYAGMVAVPCDAPQGRTGLERLGWVARDAQPTLVLRPADHGAAPAEDPGAVFGAVSLDVTDVPDEAAHAWSPPTCEPEMLALLQYTSGSTRRPRGVMVTHANVMANEHAIATTCQHDDGSVFVGWLPLFHDMGMIANVLQPIYLGSTSVLLPPPTFLAKPARWLAAISRYRGVTGGGPNFGYDLCVGRVGPAELESLDLSTWRVAFNGAEVVRAGTLRRFTEKFGPVGFAPEAFFACYGLAEATLIVAGAPRGRPPTRFPADPAALRRGRLAPCAEGTSPQTLVSSGRAVPATDIVIDVAAAAGAGAVVEPSAGRETDRNARSAGVDLGEICIRGPGVAAGYWRQDAQTVATFGADPGAPPHHRLLRTGDLGAIVDGELYVVGRLKDLIIVRGQNFYPDDLEVTAEQSHPMLRRSCAAAFSEDVDDEERLVIACEVTGTDGIDPEAIAASVRQAVAERYHIDVHAVALVRRGGVPKTTSGKVRRRACREAYRHGALALVGHSARGLARRPVTALPDLDALANQHRGPALARAVGAAVASRAGLPAATVDPEQPLSAAGLDSVGAIELAHELCRRYGVDLPPLSLLSGATAAAVAAEVLARWDTRVREVAAGASASAANVDSGPLTVTQAAMWYESQLAPPGPAYSLMRAVRLRGAFDEDAFNRAARRLVEHHPALRTRIRLAGDEPVQVVTDGADVMPEHVDLAGATAAAVRARLEVLADRGFRATDEVLFRLTVLRLADDEHIVMLAAHHIVMDLWSFVVVIRDLTDFYAAEARGSPAASRPARAALTANARQEAAMLGSAAGESMWAYWQQRLAGAPTTLALPVDRPRPPQREFRGGAHPLRIGAAVTRRCERFARQQHTTLFTVILTAFQVLLARHCGHSDVVVGVLASNRDRVEEADLVGCLVSPVPVRATLHRGEGFRDLLRRVRDDLLRDLAHARYPLARIVSQLDPPRVPGQPPLVQALVAFQREHGPRDDALLAVAMGMPGRVQLAGLAVESVPVRTAWTHVDLTLNVAEIGGELVGTLEFDRALFDEATIAGLAHRLTHVLGRLIDEPDRSVTELPVVSEDERTALLAAGRGIARERHRHQGLHELVLDQVSRSADATAITATSPDGTTQHLSYRALAGWSASLARRLAAAGAGAETLVGVFLDRCLALPVAMLAVLRRGGGYVPLDPDEPPERLAWMISDAKIHTVVTSTRLRARLPGNVPTVVDVDGARQVRRPQPSASTPADPAATSPGDARVHSGQAAYVMYTSGSTGRPKGVVVPHDAIVNRLLWMQEALSLSAVDRVAHKAPATFDVSVWELFWPLTQGACLVLTPPGDHRDPAAVARVFRREQVTTAHFVPSLLGLFLLGKGPASLPALARLVCSGEALPARLRDDVHRALPVRLFNLYGPTEAAIDVTAWECRPGEVGPVPIGTAIANTDVHVLDHGLQPVPPNVRAEIYIGGVCLARGYLNRPGLTAAAFGPNPLGGPGQRLYRSGDHAHRRHDGAIVCLGRVDDQVKIAGNRIELGEVTAALRSAPGVRDAAVTVLDDGTGPRLAAYVVGMPAPHSRIDPHSVRRWLRGRLPAAMIPAEMIALDTLPTTSAGKLDRRRLPTPAGNAAESGRPATASERRIAAVWARVLGVRDVDPDADFFALGGDSIRVLRLVAALRAAGVSTSVAALTAGATIRSLADPVAASPGGDGGGGDGDEPEPFALCPAELRASFPATVQDAYPVTRAQQAVLFHQMHNPGHETYVTRLTVRAKFNAAALRAAADTALRRHPYLRSSFDLTRHTQPLQVVSRSMRAPIAVADLRGHPSGPAEAILAEWLRQERKRKVNVESGPLARFSVHRLSDETFSLALSSFALDGWCTASVLTEFLVDYAAARRGEPSPVPTPASSYATFVALEQRAVDSAGQREFWRRELAGAPTCLVPRRARGRPAALTGRRVLRVRPDVAAGLRRVAHDLGVPLKSVLLAAHVRVVRLLTAQPTVLTGLEVNGRPEGADADRTVGVFNNIVPLRLAADARTWTELARAAWSAERRISPYRRFPLAELDRAFTVAARFNTLFVFTHFHIYEQLAAVRDIELITGEAPDRTYVALTAHANVDAVTGEQRLLLDYDPGEISEDLATAALGYYERALAHLSANPDRPPHADALLAPAQRSRLLRLGISAGPREAGVGATVHGQILRQVAHTPDAVAVTAGAESLSYASLARHSYALAVALRAAGVGPESLVALLCDGGVEQVVAILAILRAGGAYVPIDAHGERPLAPDTLARLGVAVAVGPAQVTTLVPAGCRLVTSEGRHPTRSSGGLPHVPATGLAYCLHTSGSTGAAKAIGVPHGAVVNYLRWCAQTYLRASAPNPRVLTHSPVTFDLSVTSLLAPLIVGGTVQVLPARAGPEALGAVLAAQGGADLLKITPAHFEALGRQLRLLGARVRVGCVVVGGEQLRAHHVKPWTDLAAADVVINEYGPTEATVGCCTHTRGPEEIDDPVPIGRPIAGARAFVLDDACLVPAGVAGELYIGGVGLARGYLGQPGLTASQFVPDPFGIGERLYRSGDVAVVGHDDLLRFVGRRDRQIKIRGFRVEPAEIEQELRQHPGVRDVAVTHWPAPDGRIRLVAFWMPTSGHEPGERGATEQPWPRGAGPDLRSWLSRRVPAQLVPDEFVALPALPLTRRGKVDYARLPDPAGTRREMLLALAEALTDDAAREQVTMEGRATWMTPLRYARS